MHDHEIADLYTTVHRIKPPAAQHFLEIMQTANLCTEDGLLAHT